MRMVERMIRLYLAHNLNVRKKIRKLELQIEKECNIDLLNPFYDTDRDDIEDIDKGLTTRWELPYENCVNLVAKDKGNIDKCDALVAIIEKPSIGTTLEIAYAKQQGKKVIVVSEVYSEHPWIRVYADYTFSSLQSFKDFIKEGEING
jgi:nucleoside 2-deoxyribosyltransferase